MEQPAGTNADAGIDPTEGPPLFPNKPGITSEDTLAEAGRKTWLFLLGEMLRHEEGTRLGEDTEALHDMRVATRRMRAAFDVFGEAFKPKILNQHLKRLRRAGRTLGRVRDLDVLIEKAHAYVESMDETHQHDLDPLFNAWDKERELARNDLLAYLNDHQYRQFVEDFSHFLNTPGIGEVLPPVSIPTAPKVRDIVPCLIYTRLASVRAYDQILPQATIVQMHALRIEFKKLRYTIEYFREVLGEETRLVINELKRIQDHLGDLNDAQVASQLLRQFLQAYEFEEASGISGLQAAQERPSPAGVATYLALKYAERQQLIETFPKQWENFNRSEFKRNLALAISVL